MNTITPGILLTVASTFVSYGVATIQNNPIYGAVALLLGTAIFITREILNRKGYQVGSRK